MGIAKKKQEHKTVLSTIKNKIDAKRAILAPDFLPYKDILKKKGSPILLEDGTYADLLNLPGKDLDFLDTDGPNSSTSIISDFHLFLSVYLADFDIIIIQLPADTRVQQSSWGQDVVHIDQALADDSLTDRHYQQLLQMRRHILREIRVEKDVVSEIKHQEYTAVIYGKTLAALEKNRNEFIAHAGLAFTPETVTLERKKMVLYQINNPGETIEMEEV
ncbi:hypothetical protein LNP18_06095 [Leuconostoc citreum]|uniref:hypothetical protein n=1 Tax=Leuconostoc citreum TaxID=33964 RepID=UPI00200AA2A9|nr:hypothetical protein [Leuconostoc citreum]MCK8605673.1 hypothetical protein [Leuconostoc citreum]